MHHGPAPLCGAGGAEGAAEAELELAATFAKTGATADEEELLFGGGGGGGGGGVLELGVVGGDGREVEEEELGVGSGGGGGVEYGQKKTWSDEVAVKNCRLWV
jgi:hypothetical protein